MSCEALQLFITTFSETENQLRLSQSGFFDVGRNLNFRSKTFQPLAQAIGEMALAWNDLQMVLSTTFHAASRIPNGLASDAIWNAVRSDRSQREMLISLVSLKALGYHLKPELRTELQWALKEITKLEELRNNAIHSPFLADSGGSVFAWHQLGNFRANGLKNKDALKEVRWFYDTVIVLREYIETLTVVMHSPHAKLPNRPSLPNHGDPISPKPPRPIPEAKHPRTRQPSPR